MSPCLGCPAAWAAAARRLLCCKKDGIDDDNDDPGEAAAGSLSLIFPLKVLEAATGNFFEDNLLGHGGFGPVYKGRLEDGQEIAVKKLSLDSRQGQKEFLNEVKLLLKVQHRNLVSLLGCCGEGAEKALVYEFLPNKSLDNFLFDKSKSALLSWSKRYEIVVGIAKGLLYLHEESPVRIIHRDIKASNILLDNQMIPKISDFGLARLFRAEDTHVDTMKISGTHGYMAPEYAMRGFLSVKSDVFSFGVLVLEIVSGRKNHDKRLTKDNGDLLTHAWRLFESRTHLELVDTTLETYDKDEALLCIQLGLLCCQASYTDRPDMNAVHLMLSSESLILPKPGKPGIQGRISYTSVASASTGGSHASASTGGSESRGAKNSLNTTSTASGKISSMSSLMEDTSRNSISVSFTNEGR